jgi:hypothetical protein
LGRHPVPARRWWFADADAKRNLRVGRRGGAKEQCRDSECLQDFSHDGIQVQSASQSLVPDHELFS